MCPYSLSGWTPLGPGLAGGKTVAMFSANVSGDLSHTRAARRSRHRAGPEVLDGS